MSDRPRLPIGRFVAEFAVIVVGVLVALLAESAWQERGERAEEERVLQRIANDVAGDSALLYRFEDWLDFAPAAALRTAELIEGRDTLPPTAQLAIAYAAATVVTDPDRVRTWDELVASGRLDLISSTDLRTRLIGYHGTLEDLVRRTQDQLPGEYRAVVVGIVPTDFAYRALRNCLREDASPMASVRADALASMESCREPVGRDPEALVTRLRAAPDLDLHARRLAYELELLRERVTVLFAQRDSVTAALEGAGYPVGR